MQWLDENTPNEKYKGIIVSILYFPFGLTLAIFTIFQMMALFITIVGIPVAIILSKSLSTFFNPVNKVCVPRAVAKELENRKAKQQIDKYLGVS
ncbi:YccF domain-containing protein [Ochrovirga pacifica]|uniref:YccF domain-containing protein n=1 Tax=Ochrovirga pacifica TaxID=1042376 RepID=UPI0002557FFE|nr:YccF domain-containing protein [Ochrovirga pacifica]